MSKLFLNNVKLYINAQQTCKGNVEKYFMPGRCFGNSRNMYDSTKLTLDVMGLKITTLF